MTLPGKISSAKTTKRKILKPKSWKKLKDISVTLEEKNSHAVFWNGSETLSNLTWTSSSDPLLDLKSSTVGEFLEKFVARDYLQQAKISIQNPSVFSGIRLSDAFLALFEPRVSNVHIVLESCPKTDVSAAKPVILSKYIVIMTEMNGNPIFWDRESSKPQPRFIARVEEPEMLVSLRQVLKKYLPTAYVESGMKMEAVAGDRPLALDDLLGSLFQGVTASIRIWNVPISSENGIAQLIPRVSFTLLSTEGRSWNGAEDENAKEKSKPMESFWLGGNWLEIREKIHFLLESLQVLLKEREIPSNWDAKLREEQRQLETAIRRRTRAMDEVRRSYETLRESVEEAGRTLGYKPNISENGLSDMNSAETATPLVSEPTEPLPPSDSWDNLNLPRVFNRRNDEDIPARPLGRARSILDGFAVSMRGYGLEILDEDRRLSPFAGMALTIALVVAVCIVSQYVG